MRMVDGSPIELFLKVSADGQAFPLDEQQRRRTLIPRQRDARGAARERAVEYHALATACESIFAIAGHGIVGEDAGDVRRDSRRARLQAGCWLLVARYHFASGRTDRFNVTVFGPPATDRGYPIRHAATLTCGQQPEMQAATLVSLSMRRGDRIGTQGPTGGWLDDCETVEIHPNHPVLTAAAAHGLRQHVAAAVWERVED